MSGPLIQKVNVGNLVDCEIIGFDEHPVIFRNNLLPSESDLKKRFTRSGSSKNHHLFLWGFLLHFTVALPQCLNRSRRPTRRQRWQYMKKGRKIFARQDYKANKMFSGGDQTINTRV